MAGYAALLAPVCELAEARAAAAWEFWQRGLMGHVYFCNHSHCTEEAECRKAGYKEHAELNVVARSLFKAFVNNPKLKTLIGKCIHNGRTWDNESLANLCHVSKV